MLKGKILESKVEPIALQERRDHIGQSGHSLLKVKADARAVKEQTLHTSVGSRHGSY